MDQRELWQKLYDEAQTALIKQEDQIAADVFYSYQELLNDLINHLMVLNQSVLSSEEPSLREWRALGLDQKSFQTISQKMTGINQQMVQQIAEDLKAYMAEAYARNVYGLDQTTPPQVAPTWNPPTDDYLDKWLMTPWKGERFSDQIWAINDKMALRLQNTLRDGILAGDSMQEIAADMRDDVGVPESAKLVTRPRASAQVYRAMLIARTEAMRLADEMHRVVDEENKAILESPIWTAAPGLIRVCDECAELDEMTADEILEEYGEPLRPPLHPNCRCFMLSQPKPFQELMGYPFKNIMAEPIDQYEMRVPAAVGGGRTSIDVEPYDEWLTKKGTVVNV